MTSRSVPLRSSDFRSLFITTLSLLIAACLSLSTVFLTLTAGILADNSRQSAMENSQNFLNVLTTQVNHIIEELVLSQIQVSHSSSVSSQIYLKHLDESRASTIQMDLYRLSTITSAVRKIFLYIPAIGLVIDSGTTGYKHTLLSSGETGLIDAWISGSVQSRPMRLINGESALFSFDSRLFLARDFPLTGDKRLACLFYEIEPTVISNLLRQSLPAESAVTVLSTDNQVLFSANANQAFDLDVLTTQEGEVDFVWRQGMDSMSFRQVSELTGWTTVYTTPATGTGLTARQFTLALLPTVIIALILSAVLSLVFARKIYQPIRQVRQALDPDTPAISSGSLRKNELTDVAEAYQGLARHSEQLKQSLMTVSHDATSRIFHNLMADAMEIHEKENVEEQLSAIHSPYHENDLYRVLLIEFVGPSDETERIKINLLETVHSCAMRVAEKYGVHAHVLMMFGLCYGVIFAFPRETLIATVSHLRRDYKEAIFAFARQEGIQVFMGTGHLYHSIYDLHYSYKDALASLSQKKAAQPELSGPDGATSDNVATVAVESEMPDNAALVNHVLNCVLENDVREALALARRAVCILSESPGGSEDRINRQLDFIQALLDRILEIEYIHSLPVSVEQFSMVLHDDAVRGDPARQIELTFNACNMLIQETAKMLKKQKSPHLVACQALIAERYGNFDLSQNGAAETLGINPSYLSRLFRNNLGIKFTDYLNGYRINRSIELLCQTQLSVKEISGRCGFNSVQNYIRVFKKCTGTTPRQYRVEMLSGKQL